MHAFTLSFRGRWLVLAAILATRIGGGVAPAATYYVAPGGNNAHAGLTPATAFATLQYCANRALPGDTFLVADGSYAGFNVTRSGAPGAPITFRARGSGARITSPNAFTNRDGINVEGGDWIVIEGFNCSHLERAGIRAVNADHCVIRGNTCEHNGRWGIFTGFTDDLLVENNLCAYSVAEHGIYVSNSSDRVILRGNRCHHNRGGGIQINADLSQGGDGTSSDCEITNNVIWENGLGGGAGINLDGVVGVRLTNNLLYENHASGIALFQIDGATPSRDALIQHNTIVQAANGRWCVWIADGSTGTVLRNNLLVAQHSFRGTIAVDAASRPGLDSDYNLHTNRLSLDGGGSNLSLAAWRTATGQDAHSLMAPAPDGLFPQRANGDFRLLAGSLALDAGAMLAHPLAAVDPLGQARPQGAAPDLGAFERIVSAPPVATARFVNLSTRARATPADPVIAGFVLTGDGTRTLLIRVIGPALIPAGVTTALADPALRLFSGDTEIATNDDWSAAPNVAGILAATDGASAFALPAGSRDAALLATLGPGAYTVHGTAKPAAPAGGIVLVELYDIGGAPGASARLANVSTRAVAGTGEDTVIAGFVLAGGTTPVVLRAVGPTLADFGVSGPLVDPRLELFAGADSLLANDQWSQSLNPSALALLAGQLGAFSLRAGSPDAALHTTLAPGAYTVHGAPATGDTAGGAVLVEVYAP